MFQVHISEKQRALLDFIYSFIYSWLSAFRRKRCNKINWGSWREQLKVEFHASFVTSETHASFAVRDIKELSFHSQRCPHSTVIREEHTDKWVCPWEKEQLFIYLIFTKPAWPLDLTSSIFRVCLPLPEL